MVCWGCSTPFTSSFHLFLFGSQGSRPYAFKSPPLMYLFVLIVMIKCRLPIHFCPHFFSYLGLWKIVVMHSDPFILCICLLPCRCGGNTRRFKVHVCRFLHSFLPSCYFYLGHQEIVVMHSCLFLLYSCLFSCRCGKNNGRLDDCRVSFSSSFPFATCSYPGNLGIVILPLNLYPIFTCFFSCSYNSSFISSFNLASFR